MWASQSIIACGQDEFILTNSKLHRLVAHSAADGWTRYHITLLDSWTNVVWRSLPLCKRHCGARCSLYQTHSYHRSIEFMRLSLNDLTLAPVMTTLPTAWLDSTDLRVLQDDSVALIACVGDLDCLLVHRVDHTGRTVLHSACYTCTPDVKYNPRAIDVCGNDFLVCAMDRRKQQAGGNAGLQFLSLSTNMTHACSYEGTAFKVHNEL